MKIDRKDLTKSQQDIIKEAKAQMVYLERQLDQFPDTPEEINEDIKRAVVEFYRDEQKENKAIERVVEEIYSEEEYEEVERAKEKKYTEDENEKELKKIEEIIREENRVAKSETIREESPVAESKPNEKISNRNIRATPLCPHSSNLTIFLGGVSTKIFI